MELELLNIVASNPSRTPNFEKNLKQLSETIPPEGLDLNRYCRCYCLGIVTTLEDSAPGK